MIKPLFLDCLDNPVYEEFDEALDHLELAWYEHRGSVDHLYRREFSNRNDSVPCMEFASVLVKLDMMGPDDVL